MNETIKLQLAHKTVRKFKEEKIQEEDINTLLEVCNRTATSTGMQQYSIIRIKDKSKKEKLTEIATQGYLENCPELFVFIVDVFRNKKIAEELGFKGDTYKDMDRFFQGFTDASLAAQNMTIALESMGMGAVYFGSILNDNEEVCNILKLPELTFPVFAVGFGYPDQEPQIKPRMDMKLKVFEDEYKVFENYLEEVKDYDEEMTHYYDTRANGQRSDTFSKQVLKRFEDINEKRRNVMKVIEKQGFKIK